MKQAQRSIGCDITHSALTRLLGGEFDDFLFASIDNGQNGPLLSVVSARLGRRLNWRSLVSRCDIHRRGPQCPLYVDTGRPPDRIASG